MNKTDEHRKREEYQRIASQWRQIIDDLKKEGFDINDINELNIKYPRAKQIKAIPVLLRHTEEKNPASIKENIYRHIACAADWLKGELLTETIDTLFRHFENDEMLFTQFEGGSIEFLLTLKDYEGAKTWDEIYTIDVRWAIGLALNALINHRLVSHKKYQARLQAILKNKKYRKGRSQLVLAYARLGKHEVIQDLIDL